MSKGKRYQVTVGGQLVDAFSKAAAERRVRALAADEWGVRRGFKLEVEELDGAISLVADLPDACRAYGAEFRVMISTLGYAAELQDAFRVNIGDANTPAYAVRQPTFADAMDYAKAVQQ